MVRDCPKISVFFSTKRDDEPDKASMRLHSIVPSIETKRVKKNEKSVKCFLCCGSHKMWDCLERSKMPKISKENEAELVKSQRKSALVGIGASDLFISKKAMVGAMEPHSYGLTPSRLLGVLSNDAMGPHLPSLAHIVFTRKARP
ncbi:hypothetical protein Gotri_005553 [Gossypium trilobum]|uniref:Uncharacterized protein n=1 Tax=Gossypium trilobum TaxID=34281 RepID=A0A7J9EWW7_9ROSI|nr:hypothetical protein [Gossypium trilobum]